MLFTTHGADAKLKSLLRAAGLRIERVRCPRLHPLNPPQMSDSKSSSPSERTDPRFHALADKLLADTDPTQIVASLLAQSTHRGPCPARNVTEMTSRPKERRGRTSRPRPDRSKSAGDFVTFQVSWGTKHGADPRRMLALVCRRGCVTRRDIGSIRLAPASSTVQVATHCVEAFEASVTKPDARDPRVKFRRYAPRPLPSLTEGPSPTRRRGRRRVRGLDPRTVARTFQVILEALCFAVLEPLQKRIARDLRKRAER